MDKDTLAVFQKGKTTLALLMSLVCLSPSWAVQCLDFAKTQPPKIEGRLISLSVFDMHRDPNGLLGGVHYTEGLAGSYGLPQVGVRYENANLQILVEDYLTGQVLEPGQKARLTGVLIEDRGETILMVKRFIKSKEVLGLEEHTDGSDAQILEFPN